MSEQDYYSRYESPLSYRYGSPDMRAVWSEENRWGKIRDVWVAVAEVQNSVGLVTDGELADLKEHKGELDVRRIFELEKTSGHDIAAAIHEFGEKAETGKRVIHQGLTSEDVISNAEILRIHEALGLVGTKLDKTLLAFADKIDATADQVAMGWTHLQAAEPTTVGYRLARYAQDLLIDREFLGFVKSQARGKGIKGAVGTSASFAHLLEGREISPAEHEAQIMKRLGIDPVLVSGQAYPRKIDFLVISSLSSLGQSLHRFGLDVQILQSSPFAEWAEPRRKGQIGSSAMPHKQNPINSENIDSLTSVLPGYLMSAWIPAATETLERTLRDSAGKRIWLPESFLIIDEALTRTEKVAAGLVIHEDVVDRNLDQFGPFSALELILAEAGEQGADRQDTHEVLRELASVAQSAVWRGDSNPLQALVAKDPRIRKHLAPDKVNQLFESAISHIGDAPERARQMSSLIRETISA